MNCKLFLPLSLFLHLTLPARLSSSLMRQEVEDDRMPGRPLVDSTVRHEVHLGDYGLSLSPAAQEQIMLK